MLNYQSKVCVRFCGLPAPLRRKITESQEVPSRSCENDPQNSILENIQSIQRSTPNYRGVCLSPNSISMSCARYSTGTFVNTSPSPARQTPRCNLPVDGWPTKTPDYKEFTSSHHFEAVSFDHDVNLKTERHTQSKTRSRSLFCYKTDETSASGVHYLENNEEHEKNDRQLFTTKKRLQTYSVPLERNGPGYRSTPAATIPPRRRPAETLGPFRSTSWESWQPWPPCLPSGGPARAIPHRHTDE